MTHLFPQSRSFFLVLLLGWTTLVSGQQDNKPFSYGFVSPNIKTNLKFRQAVAAMNSDEERNLLNKAVNLGCVVRKGLRNKEPKPAAQLRCAKETTENAD